MSETHWRKQQNGTPLFPDLLWSRPESKAGAGKLCIIGGSAHGFSAPGVAYNTTKQAGAGVVRVVMPSAVQKTVSALLPDADFAPSNPSGSFSKLALSTLQDTAHWSDATLLAGDFGRNSETAVMLESFIEKYSGLLTITQDAVDYFKETPTQLTSRNNTLIVLSLAQLQRIFIATPSITAITYGMSIQQLVEALRGYTNSHPAGIITKLNDILFFAKDGQVVTTKHEEKIWRVTIASRATVLWLQNPTLMLEAMASATEL